MVDPPNEAEIVIRARSGDEAAWEILVHLHQEPVFRLAYLLLGDPDDAKDIAQEAFIRTYQHLDRFDETRPLRPWLMRVASNLARNRKRSLSRYLRNLERAARKQPAEQAALDPGDVEELWQAIRQLKHDDQQVIYLRYFLEISEAEMASTLEIPRGTVKSRLHRALGRLRESIENEFPDLRSGLTT
jgi:RNA polymerase sigma-70 factor (ECF subfamily)